MIDIKIVHNDDWEALYYNNTIFCEGHKIEISDVLNAIKKYNPDFNFAYKDFYIYSDDCDFTYPIDFDKLVVNCNKIKKDVEGTNTKSYDHIWDMYLDEFEDDSDEFK